MAQTKIYKNTSDDTYLLPGVGELQPGDQVSLTSNNLPVINLENYPGVVDVVAEEASDE